VAKKIISLLPKITQALIMDTEERERPATVSSVLIRRSLGTENLAPPNSAMGYSVIRARPSLLDLTRLYNQSRVRLTELVKELRAADVRIQLARKKGRVPRSAREKRRRLLSRTLIQQEECARLLAEITAIVGEAKTFADEEQVANATNEP